MSVSLRMQKSWKKVCKIMWESLTFGTLLSQMEARGQAAHFWHAAWPHTSVREAHGWLNRRCHGGGGRGSRNHALHRCVAPACKSQGQVLPRRWQTGTGVTWKKAELNPGITTLPFNFTLLPLRYMSLLKRVGERGESSGGRKCSVKKWWCQTEMQSCLLSLRRLPLSQRRLEAKLWWHGVRVNLCEQRLLFSVRSTNLRLHHWHQFLICTLGVHVGRPALYVSI